MLLFSQAQSDQWHSRITLTNERKINTEKAEFSPTYWKDYLVYISSKSKEKIFDKKINEGYYDLFYCAINSNEELEKTASLSKILNTPYHEGPATFYDDGNKIVFSRLEQSNGQLILNEEEIAINKLYESNYENNQWSSPIISSLNIEGYTSCHPAVNENGDVVVFASDREGGYGKMDLYISYYVDSIWTEPTNLGPEINSVENEIFPTLLNNTYLFYSSNIESNEDLDIYKTNLANKNSDTPIIKFPAPINSDRDDFGLTLDKLGLSGYLSSNRKGGQGKDDIYRVKSTKSIYSYGEENYNQIEIQLNHPTDTLVSYKGSIKCKGITEEELSDFNLGSYSFENIDFDDYRITDTGKIKFDLSDGLNLISIEAEGFEKVQKVISSNSTKKQYQIKLQPNPTEQIKRDTIIKYVNSEEKKTINNIEIKEGALLIFNNIYYDYNSDEIKKGAAQELDDLAGIMKDNPEITILLSSHTDSRGKADYNLNLSKRRAISAKKYLVYKGVKSTNIKTNGLGESQLRNHCSDGVNCSEEEHIYNRRTEVRILGNQ